MLLSSAPMDHRIFAAARWHDAAWQHRQVMSLFGDLGNGPQARANGNILFRVEPRRGRVLVQSSARPTTEELAVRPLTAVFDAFAPGTMVRLLLVANTVRTINRTGPDGAVRRHRARVPDAELEGWIKHVLGNAADLHSPILTEPGELRCRRAQLITTTFRADATVTHPDELVRLCIAGIGRAKAYGCGLLSALPI